MPPPRCNTVLVEHIPPEHCSDSGLVAYFNSVFGREVVESAHVTRTLRSEVLREMDGNGLHAEEVPRGPRPKWTAKVDKLNKCSILDL